MNAADQMNAMQHDSKLGRSRLKAAAVPPLGEL